MTTVIASVEAPEASTTTVADLPVLKSKEIPEAFLGQIFQIINQTHFQGKLVGCRIKWSERIGTGKQCHRISDFTVFEDSQFSPVIRLSRSVLAQEATERIARTIFLSMAHIWLWQNKRPWGHTAEFAAIVQTFNYALVENLLPTAS